MFEFLAKANAAIPEEPIREMEMLLRAMKVVALSDWWDLKASYSTIYDHVWAPTVGVRRRQRCGTYARRLGLAVGQSGAVTLYSAWSITTIRASVFWLQQSW
ncbi:MAG: hypothetical protein J7464_05665 [Chloroflexus sp.]|jgi:hypothetical protein|nr:hypothetical protein [Chloroflexus sp.]